MSIFSDVTDKNALMGLIPVGVELAWHKVIFNNVKVT